MTHTYETTHKRYNDMDGLRFSIGGGTLAAVCGAFCIHWVLGVVSILPLFLVNGLLNYYLNAAVTYSYLRKDCGIDVSWVEARKYQDYFSPNRTHRWINASKFTLLPIEVRRDALIAAIAAFDKEYGKPDGSGKEGGSLGNSSVESDEV